MSDERGGRCCDDILGLLNGPSEGRGSKQSSKGELVTKASCFFNHDRILVKQYEGSRLRRSSTTSSSASPFRFNLGARPRWFLLAGGGRWKVRPPAVVLRSYKKRDKSLDLPDLAPSRNRTTEDMSSTLSTLKPPTDPRDAFSWRSTSVTLVALVVTCKSLFTTIAAAGCPFSEGPIRTRKPVVSNSSFSPSIPSSWSRL